MDRAGLDALFRSVEGPNEQLLTIGNYTLVAVALSVVVFWAWPAAVAICREWQDIREDRRLEEYAARLEKKRQDAYVRRLYRAHLDRTARQRQAIEASWEAARSPAWLV